MQLARVGWSDTWEAARRTVDPDAALQPVRIVAEHRGASHATDGDAVAWVELTGRAYNRAQDKRELPTVGDWVLVDHWERATGGGGAAIVRHILPRSGLLVRKAAGEVQQKFRRLRRERKILYLKIRFDIAMTLEFRPILAEKLRHATARQTISICSGKKFSSRFRQRLKSIIAESPKRFPDKNSFSEVGLFQRNGNFARIFQRDANWNSQWLARNFNWL